MLTDIFLYFTNPTILKKSELDWTDLVRKERQYPDVLNKLHFRSIAIFILKVNGLHRKMNITLNNDECILKSLLSFYLTYCVDDLNVRHFL